MFVIRFAFLAAMCLFLVPAAFAQQINTAIGQWRSHLPNQQAQSLTKAGPRLYCATIGGLFYYDFEDNSINTLSKVEGFSDVGVELVSYDNSSGITLVAYNNTNLDLIQPDGSIVNISDILRKTIIGTKQIRSVSFHNKMAYLSTSFGVVVVDLLKREIKDTYSNLGIDGAVLDVYSTTILNDSIYISARDNNGVRIQAANHATANLLDYQNWNNITLSLTGGQNVPSLAAFKNKIYAAVNLTGVYFYNGQTWQPTSYMGQRDYYLMEPNGDALMVNSRFHNAEILNPSEHRIIDHELIENTKDAHRVSENEVWLADEVNGLLRLRGEEAERIIPNGPFSVSSFDISAVNGKVVVAGGSYNPTYTQTYSTNGFYVFSEGTWTNYNPIQIKDPAQYPIEVRDVVAVAQDPASGTLYFSPWGYGLVKWNGPGDFEVFNDLNSPLINIIPGGDYTRIGGLAFDNNNNLWISSRNFSTNGNIPSLFEYNPNRPEPWKSYSIGNFAQSGLTEKLVIDDYNQKWMIMSKNTSVGLVVYNSDNNEYVHITNNGNNKLPAAQVNSLTKDLNGAIWVGTINGVAVYSSPSQIMTPGYNIDPRIRIDERYLLENQNVLDIAVDGGNRKWIATESGLWLFNESGNEMLEHFTAENSPLPSNKVTKLAVNQQTGEVFIATERGMVSYRSGATLTETSTTCKGIFPNPVRPGFTGTVGISGVPANATVKITDLSGVLVHETKANGNTATWNLTDYNGRRVQSGVYLILAASNDGTEEYMCKVAVLD